MSSKSKSGVAWRCAGCGQLTDAVFVLARQAGQGYIYICETCELRLTGNFFSLQSVCKITQCPLGHPLASEQSPRVGWLHCPTCEADMPAAWQTINAGQLLTPGPPAAQDSL